MLTVENESKLLGRLNKVLPTTRFLPHKILSTSHGIYLSFYRDSRQSNKFFASLELVERWVENMEGQTTVDPDVAYLAVTKG